MAAAASLTPGGEDSLYSRARDAMATKGFYSTSWMLIGHTGAGCPEAAGATPPHAAAPGAAATPWQARGTASTPGGGRARTSARGAQARAALGAVLLLPPLLIEFTCSAKRLDRSVKAARKRFAACPHGRSAA